VDEATDTGEEPLVYSFRPRLIGAAAAFRLGSDALEWEMGGRSGRVAYPMIGRVRLGFRPTTFMARNYTAEIFPRAGGRLQIASVSARSMFDNADQRAGFRAFVIELHRRIGRAGRECRFEAGMAAWRWWPAVVITAAMLVAALWVAGRALLGTQFATGLLLLAVGAAFVWQMGIMLLRNRPRTYSGEAIPEDVLPK